ncbi:MAG: CarD family transcriptional regulator [Clostridia bacterium]|nr:CarD family transcriptional regulator [Clostridia bacterium]NCC68893.1 CarD family transcriptional regulator [Clostridia bacterium]
MTFRVGDRIAHPLHGAGVIDCIESRKINGTEREYYVLKLPVGDMLVMIPEESCEEIGVRPIVSPEEAKKILMAIPAIDVEMTQNWNKRYRENMLKIKSGDLMEVAAVVKGLMSRDIERGLSTGERKMLHSAKQILISEIVLSVGCCYEEIEEKLNNAMICS